MNKEKTIAFFKAHGLKIAATLIGIGIIVLFAIKIDDWAETIANKLQVGNAGGKTGNDGSTTPPPPSPPQTTPVVSGPSFDLDRYAEDAEDLYKAMNRFGTDETTVFKIMNRLKTKEDLQLLSDEFGTRANTGFGSFNGTLVDWLKEELDAEELLIIKSIYKRLNTPFE